MDLRCSVTARLIPAVHDGGGCPGSSGAMSLNPTVLNLA
jgi:hypothetical protein